MCSRVFEENALADISVCRLTLNKAACHLSESSKRIFLENTSSYPKAWILDLFPVGKNSNSCALIYSKRNTR